MTDANGSNWERPYKVTIVVPCRNEVDCVERFLEGLAGQDLGGLECEVVVADGMSDDGTRQVLDRWCASHIGFSVLDNAARFVSHGLNAAIRKSTADVIVRMDVHTEYARDYVYQCVYQLTRTGAANVGGPARTKAVGYVQSAISIAFNSPFSVGGARFHNVSATGYVDTVPYGCWWRQALIGYGLFDEELVRNQDDELNLRIRRRGGRIWQSTEIKSWYMPRASLRDLFIQYMQYGYWKTRVLQKHRWSGSIRQFVPGIFVGSVITLVVLLPFFQPAKWLLTAVAGTYFALNVAASVVACRHARGIKYLPILPLAFAAFHVGYGTGFLQGMLDLVLLRRSSLQGPTSLSRSSRRAE